MRARSRIAPEFSGLSASPPGRGRREAAGEGARPNPAAQPKTSDGQLDRETECATSSRIPPHAQDSLLNHDSAPKRRGEPAYFAGAGAAGMAGIACISFSSIAGSMAGCICGMFIICPQVP